MSNVSEQAGIDAAAASERRKKGSLRELYGVLPDGAQNSTIQNTIEHGYALLVFFAFDLLFLDGEDLTGLTLVDRKTRLEAFLTGASDTATIKSFASRIFTGSRLSMDGLLRHVSHLGQREDKPARDV